MDVNLKQRLLIAIVILALIVIFVPMLFRKHQSGNIKTITAIPLAPAQPDVTKMTPEIAHQKLVIERDQQQQLQPQPTVPQQPIQQTETPPTPSSQTKVKNNHYPMIVQNVPPSQLIVNKPTVSKKQSASPKTQPVVPEPQPVAKPARSYSTLKQKIVRQQVPQTTVIKKEAIHKQTVPSVATKKETTHKSTLPPVENAKPIQINPSALGGMEKHVRLRQSSVSSSDVVPEMSAHQKRLLTSAKAQVQGWVVQLGSFSNKNNAQNLVHKLRTKGFTAFSYQANQTNGIAHRVYVGPMVKKKEAKKTQSDLLDKMHMKSIVVKFDATKLH